VPFPAPDRGDPAALAAALATWTPPPLAPRPADTARLQALRATRRGFAITSYSRLKEAEGGYQPPALDETPPPALAEESVDAAAKALDLPGGAATGLFLHALLEHADLGVLPPLAVWERQPAIERLLETQRRRWDREPRHVGAAARLVHTALTAPVALPDGSVLNGIATAPRVRREVDFLFPMRAVLDVGPTVAEDRLQVDRGFIRGVLDVLFEHDGKVYFGDWKSDALPDYGPAALRAQVAANYDLQIQIYSVALFRLLGLRDQADCDRRFGGLVYVFLRGLTGDAAGRAGLHVDRPTFAQVRAWERALVAPRFPTEVA
jgi:exodeoxyribonuclease V beta subunit